MLVTAAHIRDLSAEQQRDVIFGLDDDSAEALMWDWRFWARPAQLAPSGDWDTWVVMAGRGFGKALAIDTPLPTQSGWTTMADAVVGDTLFDETGRPCTVTQTHMVQFGRPCYRVRFSDGSEIEADEGHLWTTLDRRTRKALGRRVPGANSDKPQCQPRYFPKTVTTKEIRATLVDAGERNHAIPCTKPLVTPAHYLPIDPYLLGCWLGDGHSKESAITTADNEIVEAFVALNWRMIEKKAQNAGQATTWNILPKEESLRRDATTGRMAATGYSWITKIRELSLYKNKHIPRIYLRSSISQRRALIQGLFDTDGHCDKQSGSVEYCSTNKQLAQDVRELCLSLGVKAVMYEGRAKLDGKDCGPKYRVCFMAYFPVFRLQRKLEAQHSPGKQSARPARRYITAVEPIKSVLVRCITVDSPSSLYLAGESMIPTHNTRSGAEWVREKIKEGYKNIGLIAPTAADYRAIMVEGESGLLSVCWEKDRTHKGEHMGIPIYEPSNRLLYWANGAQAHTYSAEKPSRLRGPNHDAIWADELCAWERMQETYDMAEFTLRKGRNPQSLITTTPKPLALLREIVDAPGTIVTTGTTYENEANLSSKFFKRMRRKYEGTALGQQELHAALLSESEHALWKRKWFDNGRVSLLEVPEFKRSAVAVDPATSNTENSDETGIVFGGLGVNERGYVIEDHSGHYSPDGWARKAIECYDRNKANYIIAEKNNGGDMVELTIKLTAKAMYADGLIKSPEIPVVMVWASQGKYARAEPVSGLYEQGRISHIAADTNGSEAPYHSLSDLEDQCCTWEPNGKFRSPDRLDAVVWLWTKLMVNLDGELHSPVSFTQESYFKSV